MRVPQPDQVQPQLQLPPDATFGDVVSFLRRKHGLSQGQLARAARLSRTYIYHLETGKRLAPSVRSVRAIVRALDLHGADRLMLAQAFAHLTGSYMDEENDTLDLLDQRELAALLVRNSAFPAHSLDRLWHISAWNTPAHELFELNLSPMPVESTQLLTIVFDPKYRARFRPWEELARRLLAEFKHNTRSLTYLPEYRSLWRSLRMLPDFRRIADSSDPGWGTASFVFQMRHSRLGPLTLRTSVTVFSGASDYSIVTYVPGDQQTLATFAANGWQA
ncbi:MAG TPA: helix-turn-helix domain-containing protein [Ktedonobacterales bacterium]|nr:helix-turn-helix domain-containing protein [Ktedonobacterales bacterium]